MACIVFRESTLLDLFDWVYLWIYRKGCTHSLSRSKRSTLVYVYIFFRMCVGTKVDGYPCGNTGNRHKRVWGEGRLSLILF